VRRPAGRATGGPERIFQLSGSGLPAEFPPLRSLGNPALPNGLPVQLSSFIGREREVAEVRALVESYRLVTLTGAPSHLSAATQEPQDSS
jgi:hypothetical protein